jgi:hypothetical protein
VDVVDLVEFFGPRLVRIGRHDSGDELTVLPDNDTFSHGFLLVDVVGRCPKANRAARRGVGLGFEKLPGSYSLFTSM